MLKRLTVVSIAIVTFLAVAFPASVSANAAAEKRTRITEKMEPGILKLGKSPDARVEIQLTDKTKLSGYISEADESHSRSQTPAAQGLLLPTQTWLRSRETISRPERTLQLQR